MLKKILSLTKRESGFVITAMRVFASSRAHFRFFSSLFELKHLINIDDIYTIAIPIDFFLMTVIISIA